MVERQKIFPNTPAAIRLIGAYREAWIPNSYDPFWRECVAFSVQSTCYKHEVPLGWVLDLHKLPGSTIHKDYWESLKDHLESLSFVEEVQFEKINDFDNLVEKISTMAEDDRLILGLFPNERRSHMVHVIGATLRMFGIGSAILVYDNESGVRKIGKREFGKNFAPEALYNCIFFKERD